MKATALWSNLLRLKMPPIRTFHMSWIAFFLSFFAWFGIAPLMPVIRQELGLTKAQVGWCVIASVAATVVARIIVGAICDRIGPRRAYTGLLVLCSLPVMAAGVARSYESFIVVRLLISLIGASFVITQYHTSRMFAPNCIGVATATSAGWGNLGGGVTQFTMPLLFSGLVGLLGLSPFWAWRLAMVCAGLLCLVTGLAYYLLTCDEPDGTQWPQSRTGPATGTRAESGLLLAAARDYRVWTLFVLYGACFGVELTMPNIAALYFTDTFGLGLRAAGFAAAAYGLMNVFSRTLGGLVSDRCGSRWGLEGRVSWLFATLLCEGLALLMFSQMRFVALAIVTLMAVGLCAQMSNGATYGIVPFVNKRCLGSVAGIVGAGGNAGAIAAGFLFQGQLAWSTALMVLGLLVTTCSFLALAIRFSPAHEASVLADYERALSDRPAALTGAATA